jgi:hypothetical protein
MFVAALAMAASGCALFQKSETVRAPAPAPVVATVKPTPFTPAFDAGAPVALMPCRGAAALGDTCKRMSVSHERRGDMPAGENSETFSDATTVSLSQEE